MPVGLEEERGEGTRYREEGETSRETRGENGRGEEKHKQRADEKRVEGKGRRDGSRCNQRGTPISTLERFPLGGPGIVKGAG